MVTEQRFQRVRGAFSIAIACHGVASLGFLGQLSTLKLPLKTDQMNLVEANDHPASEASKFPAEATTTNTRTALEIVNIVERHGEEETTDTKLDL